MEAARSKGIDVRREPMSRGTSGGGFCVLKGKPTVFVDERASVDAQIEIMASAMRRMDWSEVTLDPAVTAVLARRRAKDGDAAG